MSPQHFPKSTVSASFWCSKCNRFTQHRISDGRKDCCLECLDRLNKEHAERQAQAQTQPPAPTQGKLF